MWQIQILSCSIKDLKWLGFKYNYNLYDDPAQRCSLELLLQLHLLLYSGCDKNFLTLLEEKQAFLLGWGQKTQKGHPVYRGPVSGQQGAIPYFRKSADCDDCRHWCLLAAPTEHTEKGIPPHRPAEISWFSFGFWEFWKLSLMKKWPRAIPGLSSTTRSHQSVGWFGAQTEAPKILPFCLQRRLHDLSEIYFEVCSFREMQKKSVKSLIP